MSQSPSKSETTTAAGLLLECLKLEEVSHVFGIPGGPVTPLFDALYHDERIVTVSPRHEAGAAFMAAGYARVSGKLGVCCLTTGPGATNAVTALAAAKADSLPVLAVTAQVATVAFGKGSLQDSTQSGVDTVDLFKAVTKMSVMLANPHNLAMTLRQAVRAAFSGRRGPVHLNIPTDFMRRPVRRELQRPDQYRPATSLFDRGAVKRAAALLLGAQRHAILAGHGVCLANAQSELLELSELLDIPVASTPKGKGVFPETHELALRVFGLASSPRAEGYLLEGGVDVLLVLGSGLHEISTQGWESRLQPTAAFIQQDIDPANIGRNYSVDVALAGDAKATLRELLFETKRLLARSGPAPERRQAFLRWKAGVPAVQNAGAADCLSAPLKPQRVMAELNEALPEDAVIFLDVGNHTLWALHYLEATGKNLFIHNWGEFAAMGHGVAGAIGGKLAAPKRPVVAIVGDGGFGMAGMEVSTAVTYGVPVVWIVFNDARYNAVHHGQHLQYDGRTIGTEFHRMDLAAVAEALGAVGRRISAAGDLKGVLAEALSCGRPVVLDVRIDADEVPPIHSRVRALERFFAGVPE